MYQPNADLQLRYFSSYKITLSLNTTFKGRDLDDLDPPFIAMRPFVMQREWGCSASGPDSYVFIITCIASYQFLIKPFMHAFISEFGKDFAHWCSQKKFKDVWKRKRHGEGMIRIVFKNGQLDIDAPHPSDDAFADVWLEIGLILEEYAKYNKKYGVAHKDPNTGKWIIE